MHELKDIGPDHKDRENNFGLYTYDDAPKVAACFMKEAAEIAKNAKYIDIRRPFPDVIVARAQMVDRQKIVLWTSSPFVSARYILPVGSESGHAMCDPKGSAANLDDKLGPKPIIFDFDASTPIRLQITQ